MDGWWRDVLSAGQNGNDPLVFSDRLVLLSDAWNASSAKGNETRSFLSRVNRGRRLPGAAETLRAANQAVPLLPAGTIDRLPQDDPEKALELVHGALITTMKREGRAEPVPFVRNQAKENFHYHRIDVDIVPPDRLEGGPNPPSRRAEGPSRNHRIAKPAIRRHALCTRTRRFFGIAGRCQCAGSRAAHLRRLVLPLCIVALSAWGLPASVTAHPTTSPTNR